MPLLTDAPPAPGLEPSILDQTPHSWSTQPVFGLSALGNALFASADAHAEFAAERVLRVRNNAVEALVGKAWTGLAERLDRSAPQTLDLTGSGEAEGLRIIPVDGPLGPLWIAALRRAHVFDEGAFIATGRQAGLTATQTAVLIRLARGWSVDQAARDLGIAETTVRVHIKALYRRLQVSDRAAAIERIIAMAR